MANNPLIPLMGKSPEIMTPFQLAEGMAKIEEIRANTKVKQKALEPKQLTEKEKIETAISKVAYVAQNLKPFIGKEYDPNTDLQYRNTKARIESELGTKLQLPDKYDKTTVSTAYEQGLSVGSGLTQRYQQFSSTKGIGSFDTFTGSRQLDPSGLIAPNASSELVGEMSREREAWKGHAGLDENMREIVAPLKDWNPTWDSSRKFPDQASSIIGSGITQVESGGNPNPARATNPNSSAYGATQVTNATQQDSGFNMPPFPKNGTAQDQQAWSATLMNHYLRVFNGDQNKATQAWHDGVAAVQQGRPDTTGYVDKVNRNMGIRSPSLQEQERVKANVDIDKTRQQEAIKSEQKIKETRGLSEAKRETSGTNINNLLNQKFDGKNIDEIIDESTGSGMGNMVDAAGRFIGASTESSLATNKLKTISGWLVSNVPRMEGPQSDFDVKNYQQMAGAIADPTTTRKERKAAFNTIKQIVSKYSEQGQGKQQVSTPSGRSTAYLLNLYGGE